MQNNRYHKMNFECAFCSTVKNGSLMKYMGVNHSMFWNSIAKNESNHICIDCLNMFFLKCDKCNRYCEKNITIHIENSNKNLCMSCAIEQKNISICKCCKKYFENNLGKKYCNNCFNKMFARCNCCSRFEEKSKLIFGSYCNNCFNNRAVEVQSYSYKPTPKFFHLDEQNPLFLGVELEIGNSTIPNVNRFTHCIDKNYFYPKFDSSIPVFGCEVVSHPCSYQFHVSTGIWKNLLQNACKYGLKATERTGIHVHMNRNFFTPEEIANLDYFINSYNEFWANVAKRRSSYAQYVNKNSYNWGSQVGSRHCALNLSNRNTIELRIFKSSTDVTEIKRILTICDGVANFIKSIKTNIIHRGYNNITDKFVEYIKTNYDLAI